MRVTVSKEARKDLIAIKKYIRDELLNPDASLRIINLLRREIEGLKFFPRKGKPLDAVISIHTEYRFLICENYCIFYLENNEEVIVVRILHQKQDWLSTLFR